MSIKIEETVTTVKSVTEAAGELSVTQLIMDASPLVQGVMLFLLLLSIVSWTIIFQRGKYLKM